MNTFDAEDLDFTVCSPKKLVQLRVKYADRIAKQEQEIERQGMFTVDGLLTVLNRGTL